MSTHGRRGLSCHAVILRDQALLHPFLLLHPAVLEPDFNLGLVELERARDFYPPGAGQVLVEVELLLQLGQLFRREVGPPGVVHAAGVVAPGVAVRVRLRN